jgi:putative transposase
MDLDTAIKNCCQSGFGFPKWKVKKHQADSFRIPQSNGKSKHIKITKKAIKIPKIGWVKWIRHRPIEGKVKSITIKQIGEFWYVSVLCEQLDNQQLPEVFDDEILGLDFGLKDFITDNNGVKVTGPKAYRKNQKKLKAKQRKLSRCKKGSNRRNKQRIRVAKQHRKIANIRRDFLHQFSSAIAKQYKWVGVEDLNIKGMARNRRWAKSVFDSGWAYFLSILKYKLEQVGGGLIKMDRKYPSTKTCSDCGQIKDMPLDIRQYICDCGLDLDRDWNAAINIRREAINKLSRTGTVRIQARGGASGGGMGYHIPSYASMKREKFQDQDLEAA